MCDKKWPHMSIFSEKPTNECEEKCLPEMNLFRKRRGGPSWSVKGTNVFFHSKALLPHPVDARVYRIAELFSSTHVYSPWLV